MLRALDLLSARTIDVSLFLTMADVSFTFYVPKMTHLWCEWQATRGHVA